MIGPPTDAAEDRIEVGVAIVGQSAHLVPADKKLYALRDVTGTVRIGSLLHGRIHEHNPQGAHRMLAAGTSADGGDVFDRSGADPELLDNQNCGARSA